MSEEEFLNRTLNKIDKEFGYDVASTLELMFIKKDKKVEQLENIINELEKYIKAYLYMLNGIQDRDVYEQCQLDDFTEIMEKLQELKENK